jgi:aspartate/methionine/tyrosine aminotransferase
LPPEGARRVLAGLDPADPELHRYGPTAGLARLRAEMARVFARRGLEVDPATEILVGKGGTHALYSAARTVLDDDDEVLMLAPYWPLAPGVFTACGAVPIDTTLARLTRTPKTKALYFITPNNPDGKVLSIAELEKIASFARAHDLWVFADEVYSDITYGTPLPSIATLPGMRQRTIVLHSLSKSHALAGLRVGYVAAPEPVITAARRVSTHTAFNVSVAMQRAAIAALEDDVFPATARDTYRFARDAAVAALAGAPIDFHVPDGATYLFLDFKRALGPGGPAEGAPTAGVATEGLQALLERAIDRGVLLAPGEAFGNAYAESFARLCFTAVPLERVLLGIERLRQAIL